MNYNEIAKRTAVRYALLHEGIKAEIKVSLLERILREELVVASVLNQGEKHTEDRESILAEKIDRKILAELDIKPRKGNRVYYIIRNATSSGEEPTNAVALRVYNEFKENLRSHRLCGVQALEMIENYLKRKGLI